MKPLKRLMLALGLVLGLSSTALAITPASFPGGEEAQAKYIQVNLKYPASAKENGIEGVVAVIFTVKTDGSIGNIKIKRMVDPDLESEAIRLVKQMPAWQPATDNGQPVESTAEIDVPFTLE